MAEVTNTPGRQPRYRLEPRHDGNCLELRYHFIHLFGTRPYMLHAIQIGGPLPSHPCVAWHTHRTENPKKKNECNTDAMCIVMLTKLEQTRLPFNKHCIRPTGAGVSVCNGFFRNQYISTRQIQLSPSNTTQRHRHAWLQIDT